MKLLALATLLAGCADDPAIDLTGIYQVDSYVLELPCGTDATPATTPPFLELHHLDDNGFNIGVFQECSDAAATMCTTGSGIYEDLLSNGWRGDNSFDTTTGGTDCHLGYALDTAVISGNKLKVEHTQYGESVTIDPSSCTPAEARARGTAMPCEKHLVVDATRL